MRQNLLVWVVSKRKTSESIEESIKYNGNVERIAG